MLVPCLQFGINVSVSNNVYVIWMLHINENLCKKLRHVNFFQLGIYSVDLYDSRWLVSPHIHSTCLIKRCKNMPKWRIASLTHPHDAFHSKFYISVVVALSYIAAYIHTLQNRCYRKEKYDTSFNQTHYQHHCLKPNFWYWTATVYLDMISAIYSIYSLQRCWIHDVCH